MSASSSIASLVHHDRADLQPANLAATAPFEMEPFDAELLMRRGIDSSKCVWTEITPNNLRGLALKHVASLPSNMSFVPYVHNTEASLAQQLSGHDEGPTSRVHLGAGLGVFSFDFDQHKMHLVHGRRGPIVGTNCGPDTWENVVLLCEGEGGKEATQAFLNKLLFDEESTRDNDFTIFRWVVKYGEWEEVGRKAARSLGSVVLPQDTKDKITADLDQFLTPSTYKFYVEHGIPYKRSFLFYGEPGAGKTSLIQALAGKYRRNLCIMQPTSDPKFNDDSLADAIKDAPPRSIIVLEDVDALFDKNRQANTKLAITFSGLLNALDGIANPDGQLFILTTNFRDQLDAALIRNGRVDLHVEFTHATREQMEMLFAQFYPDAAAAQAEEFAGAVAAVLGGRKVNMAALQHYFVTHRRSSAGEAIGGVQAIVDDMKERDEGKKDAEEQDKKKKKKKGGKGKGKSLKSKAGGRGGGAGTVNVYINSPTAPDDASSSSSDGSASSDDGGSDESGESDEE